MKTYYIKLWLGFCLMLIVCTGNLFAERLPSTNKQPNTGFRTADACVPPNAFSQLDINNVKCLLHNGGDMWWDLVGLPRYEIPKGSGKHSLFAASLWIGGTDAAGQMRVAAQTYRQDGYDFWPGPLSNQAAEVDDAVCEKWNKMFKINKAEIDAFRADFDATGSPDMANYPGVQAWKAATSATDLDGNLVSYVKDGQTKYMAPFVDVNGDLTYDPADGDYPDIKGDQAVWWVINDKGNVHTATNGQPIGVELHIMAFGFTTANAVNNMTFYDQIVINRSSILLGETYMGQWVDADLGYFKDDYVGCDTTRGLGICYNSDNTDDLPTGYGVAPPAVGVDFFQGPLADFKDGIDNDKDGVADPYILDTLNNDTTWLPENIIMSKFVYYNNDFSLKGNPEVAQHYYNYLRGIWKDGTKMVANGKDAYAPTAAGDPTNYIFPGDICSQTGWVEGTAAGTSPDDRRLLQSAGPFTLQPGAVNQVVTGVVWARGSSNLNSVCQLIIADDIAQALFDNNFRLLEGPDAPEVSKAEFDKSVVLSWKYSNPKENNYNEAYLQADPVLKADGTADSLFAFQGYVVYQLKDKTVNLNDLSDPTKAKMVGQCDIIDDVSTIVNRTETIINDAGGNLQTVIEDKIMVEGQNKGLFHSLKITEDLFSVNQFKGLKNYTPYYFAVIAYAYNNVTSDGRKFVPGNGKFSRALVEVIPHGVAMENGGTELSSEVGDGIDITQIGGYGNGGNFCRLTDETEASILAAASGIADKITYKGGYAPISVKVVNPKDVQKADYKVEVVKKRFERAVVLYPNPDNTPGAPANVIDSTFTDWVLYKDGVEIYKSTYIVRNTTQEARPKPMSGNEQLIDGYGIAIAVRDVVQGGDTVSANAGIIGSEIVFKDPNSKWLTGLADVDATATDPWNWILAGPKSDNGGGENRMYKSAGLYDKFQNFEKVIGGTWSPFCYANGFINSSSSGTDIRPGLPLGFSETDRQLGANEVLSPSQLSDIEVVLTPDDSKWTRCIVTESSPNSKLGSGAWLASGKWAANVDKNGQKEMAAPQVDNHGLSWFPGYAIDVNTGRRLAVFFSESTWDHQNRGDDMVFNPTSSVGANLDKVGGRHYLHITDLTYTGPSNGAIDTFRKYLMNEDKLPVGAGSFFDAIAFPLIDTFTLNMAGVYNHVAWTTVAMSQFGYDIADPHKMPTEARISIRLNQSYLNRAFNTAAPSGNPTFVFNTGDATPRTKVAEIAKDALEDIRVVPNPYYGYSEYESAQLESLVKITNLPKTCTITIFNTNGQLVRTFNKDNDSPQQIWDLKNQNGVPAASGVYIVHINAPGIGEKVVKMFAVMRQLDLNGF